MEQENYASGKPIQILSWSEKNKNGKEWFKKNIDYHIADNHFGSHGNFNKEEQDLQMLYEVYNNKFPLSWFSHITDPLNAKDARHKNFPAKVRPVTILRTNLDLLMAEYPRRPFIYQVNNMGDDGYSRYQEALNERIMSNVTMLFLVKYRDWETDRKSVV